MLPVLWTKFSHLQWWDNRYAPEPILTAMGPRVKEAGVLHLTIHLTNFDSLPRCDSQAQAMLGVRGTTYHSVLAKTPRPPTAAFSICIEPETHDACLRVYTNRSSWLMRVKKLLTCEDHVL